MLPQTWVLSSKPALCVLQKPGTPWLLRLSQLSVAGWAPTGEDSQWQAVWEWTRHHKQTRRKPHMLPLDDFGKMLYFISYSRHTNYCFQLCHTHTTCFLTLQFSFAQTQSGGFNAIILTRNHLSLVGLFFSPHQKSKGREFPGGPVVKTPPFHCRGAGFNPWLGK